MINERKADEACGSAFWHVRCSKALLKKEEDHERKVNSNRRDWTDGGNDDFVRRSECRCSRRKAASSGRANDRRQPDRAPSGRDRLEREEKDPRQSRLQRQRTEDRRGRRHHRLAGP